jgi:pimeloyl-ACP methyl ester carboxylesterase/membrane protein DedA with SNARE-associated domain
MIFGRGRTLRWVLVLYAALLIASHIIRWIRPWTPTPDRDEQVIAVAEVRAGGQTTRPVLIATIDSGAPTSERLPVVLLHGSPGSNGETRALAGHLSHTRRVLAPDLPGFGASTRRIPDYSILAHANYVEQLLDSLGIRRYHVVGFSLGGGVAAHLAHRRPERVASLTLLSSIGVQEYELLGDYLLNHALHGMQLVMLSLLREGFPHFGALDDSFFGVEYARNFYDTDQRPLRGILTQWSGPALIIQGDRDPLVPPEIAIEHGRIMPQSEVHLIPGDHFMTFARADEVAGLIGEFVDRAERGRAATRATADPERVARSARPFDPADLPRPVGFSVALVLLLLALATLISEDLACIAAGLMVGRGTLEFWPAVGACMTGIVIGDLLLYLLGRFLGRPALRAPPLRWVVNEADVTRSSRWFARRGMWIVLASRFMPGTRLPTFVAAGMLHTRLPSFLLAFLVASALWVPALVGGSAVFGGQLLEWFSANGRLAGVAFVAGVVLLYLVVAGATRLATWRGRRLLVSRWRRLTRWEFWPLWMFYPPVLLYVVWLGLRHRSLTLFTCANPAMPAGGLVGESKSAILRGLGAGPAIAPSLLLERAVPLEERLARLNDFTQRHRLAWPVVLKPDVGERGLGVHFARDHDSARAYLEGAGYDVIAQAVVGGAEFGVFYYRLPGEGAGRIFAITEKHLPDVVGDGQQTLEQLILSDRRAVCSARFFLRQHADRLDWVPFLGQKVPLTLLGTHSRGALFMDGTRLATPELTAAIDRLSQGYPGFWFGRYDLRAPDAEALKAGGPFTVLELNGVSSEATSIYDPDHSLLQAYRTLFAQWRLAFEIGRRNRDRGARPATPAELIRLLRHHWRTTRAVKEAAMLT